MGIKDCLWACRVLEVLGGWSAPKCGAKELNLRLCYSFIDISVLFIDLMPVLHKRNDER